jgi:hypothetical protein
LTPERSRSVPAWASDEWAQELTALAESRPPVAGATSTISVAITGGKAGDATYHWSYRDGVPVAGATGAAVDADLALTISNVDAQTIVAGEVEPSVAYMRGRLKATGDGALLLGWLASTATDEYQEWRRHVQSALDRISGA